MSEAVETLDGWYTLHDFRTIDWSAWKGATDEVRETALQELQNLYTTWEKTEKDRQGSFGVYSIVGQKADLLFIHMRPTMEELNKIETEFNKTTFAEFLVPAYSYVSVVELSSYLGKGKDPDTDPELQARLKPVLPKWNHVCFYPMDKRREGNDNWYSMPMADRGKLMREHGRTGKKYAGKVR